ncbi:MAG: indole-3-glycerol phosphate synthase TrpC [Dehalococcoidales bacterium]
MILDQIVADKLLELEARKQAFPVYGLERDALRQPPPLDFASALRGDSVRLIAEIKRASPSKGIIRSNFDPLEIASIYTAHGASAISVLTETRYFQGSLSYLAEIRDSLGDKKVPLLRKDFLTDPYQIYESRANGADCLLLIVAILNAEKLEELLGLSHRLKMSCLVEVHNEAELEIALNSQAKIIGINNRDLTTFETDPETTERLCSQIPKDRIIVSESGIKDRDDIERMARCGVDAVLIGESLMAAKDIAAKMAELL